MSVYTTLTGFPDELVQLATIIVNNGGTFTATLDSDPDSTLVNIAIDNPDYFLVRHFLNGNVGYSLITLTTLGQNNLLSGVNTGTNTTGTTTIDAGSPYSVPAFPATGATDGWTLQHSGIGWVSGYSDEVLNLLDDVVADNDNYYWDYNILADAVEINIAWAYPTLFKVEKTDDGANTYVITATGTPDGATAQTTVKHPKGAASNPPANRGTGNNPNNQNPNNQNPNNPNIHKPINQQIDSFFKGLSTVALVGLAVGVLVIFGGNKK